MVQVNELRIGNWVNINGLNLPLTGELFCLIVTGQIVKPSPIPLSPEILEKINWNGYRKFYFNSHFSIDDECHFYYHNDYTGVNINYLHQLQNLYYCLVGQELNITL
jgi:hypothetical protein